MEVVKKVMLDSLPTSYIIYSVHVCLSKMVTHWLSSIIVVFKTGIRSCAEQAHSCQCPFWYQFYLWHCPGGCNENCNHHVVVDCHIPFRSMICTSGRELLRTEYWSYYGSMCFVDIWVMDRFRIQRGKQFAMEGLIYLWCLYLSSSNMFSILDCGAALAPPFSCSSTLLFLQSCLSYM